MSTLETFYCKGVVAYCNGAVVDGTLPPSEGTNDPTTGQSRGLVRLAKKATFITDIAVHNRHTADAYLMIAHTPGGVFYNPGQPNHMRRSPDAGWKIPAGQSLDVLVGRRWSMPVMPGGCGLIVLTNIAIFGLSALNIDIIGETN